MMQINMIIIFNRAANNLGLITICYYKYIYEAVVEMGQNKQSLTKIIVSYCPNYGYTACTKITLNPYQYK